MRSLKNGGLECWGLLFYAFAGLSQFDLSTYLVLIPVPYITDEGSVPFARSGMDGDALSLEIGIISGFERMDCLELSWTCSFCAA